MPNNRVTLILDGLPEEEFHIRLTDFLRELNLLLQVLKETERQITARHEQSTYYRVVDLSHSSPATIVVEAVPRVGEQDLSGTIVSELFGILSNIADNGNLTQKVSSNLLSSIRDMTSPIGRTLSRVNISCDNIKIEMNKAYYRKIEELLSPEDTFPGSVKGMLEAINLHKDANIFRIYPDIGPSKITCAFPAEMQMAAVAGVGRFVEVRGVLEYKSASPYPDRILVEEIIVYPHEDELPSLNELRGIAPNATGDLTSEAFVRQLRNVSA